MPEMIRLAPDLQISPEAVTDTFAILGIRGSGKTNTAVDLAEEMIEAGNVVAVHDPLDVWWGLKSGADGESPGLPVVVFGGRHADAPLEAESGTVLARWVMSARHPMVMSTKHLSHAGQARFVTDFAIELYRRNDEPIHVILDEIARIAPQNLTGRPELARCVGAVVDLGSEGRASGIGTTVIGQRAARVSKDVLTQAHTMIAMATVSAQDRKAIAEWIGENGDEAARRTMMSDIASLPRGTGYYYAPRESELRKVAFRARRTFDSSATPRVGERRAEARVFAAVDLSNLTAEIQATVEEARANDPKVLRAEIEQLKKRAGSASAEQLAGALERERRAGDHAAELQRRLTDALGRVAEFGRLLADIARMADVGDITPVPAGPSAQNDQNDTPEPAGEARAPERARAPARRRREPVETAPFPTPIVALSTDLSPGEQRIVDALRSRLPLRTSIAQLASFANYKPSGGAFRTAMRNLRTAGILTEDGNGIVFTPAGAARLGIRTDGPRPTGRALCDRLRGAMRTSTELRLFDLVTAVAPRIRWSVGELADASGYNPAGGAFRTGLRTMVQNEILVRDGQGYRLHEDLR